MKSFITSALFATLLALTSCAHHTHGGCNCGDQCEMHKDGKKCEGAQCHMKSEKVSDEKTTEAKK